MSDQNINIKLDRGGPENHAWTVLGTLLACGAVGMAAWAISNAGALVILCGPGQGGDSPMLGPLLDGLSVARPGPGRPRTRPDMLRGDKAYSSRATRKTLRRRGIKTVIPEPRNQQQHRRNRGSRGGRPVNLDVEAYRGRNVIERGYSDVKQWRGLATRYDKLGLTYRAGAVLRAIVQWLNHLL